MKVRGDEGTGIALARGHVDFTVFQKQNLEIEERRLMPRYVEAHRRSTLALCGLESARQITGTGCHPKSGAET